jgi:hypothetical protein
MVEILKAPKDDRFQVIAEEVLGWRSHRIADDAKHQARQSAGFKPAGIVG